MRIINDNHITEFERYLKEEEKSGATLEKYIRDINMFRKWLNGAVIEKETVLKYRNKMIEEYAASSVNSMISSLNSFFAFHEWHELRIKTVKIQRQIFASDEKELTKPEYERLLKAAQSKKNERLYLLMQTICSSGMRVSELKYVTVEALQKEYAEVKNKGKLRRVFLPRELCRMLKSYCRAQNRKSGTVFVTRNGKPLDRSNIWSDMKKLCKAAGVSEQKVFPHNLRHLFARTYYSLQKDVVRLADILGHSSVNTTRIYTMETGKIHQKQIQKLGLLRC